MVSGHPPARDSAGQELTGSRRRSSFFLVGLYIGSMVVSLLILHFGVEGSVNDPTSAVRLCLGPGPTSAYELTLDSTQMRGLFLFASLAGGLIMGAACVFWWKFASHLTPAFAGFAFGLYIQSVRNDGLIRPVGLRYVLFIGESCDGVGL